jgi:tetratricopeptide (TPR) repeat protein
MTGDAARALEAAELAFAERDTMGYSQEYTKQAFVTGTGAALQLGDLAKAEELLSIVEGRPPGKTTQFLQAQCDRFRGQIAARESRADEAERRFKRAAGLFRELAMVFYLGVTELELGEWLVSADRVEEAEPLLAEAREIFERLEAKPWIERVEAAMPLATTP